MKFQPQKKGPPTMPKQIRINVKDWERIKEIAEETGEYPTEIARQAIHFALENM